jgi:hypothetical protein
MWPELHVSLLPKENGGDANTSKPHLQWITVFSLQVTLLSQTAQQCAESVQGVEAESAEMAEIKPYRTCNTCQVCLNV